MTGGCGVLGRQIRSVSEAHAVMCRTWPHATLRVNSKRLPISRRAGETKEPWLQLVMDTPAEESEAVRIRQTQAVHRSLWGQWHGYFWKVLHPSLAISHMPEEGRIGLTHTLRQGSRRRSCYTLVESGEMSDWRD